MHYEYTSMTPYQKLEITSFASIIIIVAALSAIGFLLGFRVLLFIVCMLAALFLIVELLLLIKPFLTARRLYSVRSPRQAYDEVSSREGYCKFDSLPNALIIAVRCSEDPHFYRHKGIDYDFLIKAVAHNIFTSLKPVGASTITQQTIKNMYLTPEASIQRKLTEMLMTRRMERELSKNEILELYLNIIYYGCGKYGIHDAALHYYGITPAQMNFDQCLSLAAILPCPDKYNRNANPVYFYQMKRRSLGAVLASSDFPYNEIKLEQ